MQIQAQQEKSVSTQLRPLVILVATASMAVATLLITTAALGASPVASYEITRMDG